VRLKATPYGRTDFANTRIINAVWYKTRTMKSVSQILNINQKVDLHSFTGIHHLAHAFFFLHQSFALRTLMMFDEDR
jgi:hypothetical protein